MMRLRFLLVVGPLVTAFALQPAGADAVEDDSASPISRETRAAARKILRARPHAGPKVAVTSIHNEAIQMREALRSIIRQADAGQTDLDWRRLASRKTTMATRRTIREQRLAPTRAASTPDRVDARAQAILEQVEALLEEPDESVRLRKARNVLLSLERPALQRQFEMRRDHQPTFLILAPRFEEEGAQ